MFKGPEKDDNEGFADWKDFHHAGNTPNFEYNPAASDITKQSGEFPEVSDMEYPEKM